MGIVREIMYDHLIQEGGQEAEQKGCKSGCDRTIDHLLTNQGHTQKLKNEKNQIIHSMVRRQKKLLIVHNIHG